MKKRNFLYKFALIAAASWITWSLLIYTSKPHPPEGIKEIAFLLTMLAALVACIVISFGYFRQSSLRWRRSTSLIVGFASFLIVLAVGHALGTSIAAGNL